MAVNSDIDEKVKMPSENGWTTKMRLKVQRQLQSIYLRR